jgi:hypothetical protein
MVFANAGLFPVRSEAGFAQRVVGGRSPIVGIYDGRILSLSSSEETSRYQVPRPRTPSELARFVSQVGEPLPGAGVALPKAWDPGLRMTEDQFLDALLRLREEK